MNAPAQQRPAPQRNAVGPQVGAPPSLEQIPVGRLSVDPAYQRATDGAASRRIIFGMVRQWDWALCQPLVVARREDGSLLIIDGQHRHAGALERGDIPFLPCVVIASLDRAGEARTFVELNTRRQKLTQSEVFHGMLAAGDADARAVADLIAATGWTVRRTSNTATYGPGDMECAPMLVKVFKRSGEAPVRFARTMLRAAYPDAPVRQSATLFKALFEVFDHLPDDPVPTAALVGAIGAVASDIWLSRGLLHRERHPAMSITSAIAAAMLLAAKGEEHPVTKPVRSAPTVKQAMTVAPRVQPSPAVTAPAPRPPASRPPAKPDAFTFGTSGKGWCGQCDQLVSRQKAEACIDRFCHARPHT